MESKEPKWNCVKEVNIIGNNLWCAFFKFAGEDDQVGFFRIHRLFADSRADVKTKKLEQASDLKAFLTANEDKKFWAKVVEYNTTCTSDSDAAYFKTDDGRNEVVPRWRAEIVWVGSEVEPRQKVRVFHVDHPDTKVLRIELVPNTFLFKFEVDGAKEFGRVSPEKVVVDGKRVENYKLRHAAALFKTLTEPTEGEAKPVWALAIPNFRIAKDSKDSGAVEVDGEKVIPKWYANTVWVSEDSTPPTDALNKKPARGFFKKRSGDFIKKKWQNKNKASAKSQSHDKGSQNLQSEPKSLAEALARRAMSCLNPNDPKIATVVTNAKEMETALLIAKVLETSALLFNAANVVKPASVDSEGALRIPATAESGLDSGKVHELGMGGYPHRSNDNPLNGAFQDLRVGSGGPSRSPRGHGLRSNFDPDGDCY